MSDVSFGGGKVAFVFPFIKSSSGGGNGALSNNNRPPVFVSSFFQQMEQTHQKTKIWKDGRQFIQADFCPSKQISDCGNKLAKEEKFPEAS